MYSDGCGRADLCEVTKPIFGSDSSNGGHCKTVILIGLSDYSDKSVQGLV